MFKNFWPTPAESTAYRLAKHDVEQLPDIRTAAEPGGTPYYTNSSHLPVGYTDDIFSALDIQDELQTLYTSGTVFHAFLGERLSDWKTAAQLVRKIAENYRLPYYTLSPTYSICREHGYLSGEQPECPICHQKTEVYSRITGYYRPVQNWNDGKVQEYRQRKNYRLAGNVFHPAADSSVREPKATDAEDERKHREHELPGTLKLFSTAACPNCRIAKEKLQHAGIHPEYIIAEEQPELCSRYGILTAPTLVSETSNGPTLYTGVPEILHYIDTVAGN